MTDAQTEIRYQDMPGTDRLIQSSCVLEIADAQYLIKIVASKKVISGPSNSSRRIKRVIQPKERSFLDDV